MNKTSTVLLLKMPEILPVHDDDVDDVNVEFAGKTLIHALKQVSTKFAVFHTCNPPSLFDEDVIKFLWQHDGSKHDAGSGGFAIVQGTLKLQDKNIKYHFYDCVPEFATDIYFEIDNNTGVNS